MRPIRIPHLSFFSGIASTTATTRTTRTARIAAAAMAAVAALSACSGPAPSHPAAIDATKAPPTYYLALGDSLARGVQPNAAGTSVETGYGYPDQVYATLHRSHPMLELVKLGCPGETTISMINGGICHYSSGSQLKAAVAFLREHRGQEHRGQEHNGRVFLVTLDIGANDPKPAAASPASTSSPSAPSRASRPPSPTWARS